VCIVNRPQVALAAVISSYFSAAGTYLPVFGFPDIRDSLRSGAVHGDDDYISNIVATRPATFIHNAIANLGGCDFLILAGLSTAQLSYLHSAGRAQIVEIGTIDDVDCALRAIGVERVASILCPSKQVLLGLHLAKRRGCRLVINEQAPPLVQPPEPYADGLFVVEDVLDNIGSVVAVNFAFSVGADVYFTDPLEHTERQDIREGLIAWKVKDSDRDYQDLRRKIGKRIGNVDLRRYKYATFVSEGLPYSLGMENEIPCSYLDLFSADLLVHNSIVSENAQAYNVAVVFSIDEFIFDGEVQWLVEHLGHDGYFVRTLVGTDATVRNLDYNVQHFPYSLLHISSHGGAIDGSVVSQDFTDRAGITHRVQYEEVVTFDPIPGNDQVRVSRKVFPRTLDGLRWRSPELKSQRLPEYVYDDMEAAISTLKDDAGRVITRQEARVSGSCGIRCHDQTHQGMFQVLACHTSPIVFNNTCWSAADIADFFLSSGVRGYIGTLWAIGNATATRAAETFYRKASTTTLIEAMHAANTDVQSTSDRDVYVYYGVHFSTLRSHVSVAASMSEAFKRLTMFLFQMIAQARDTQSAEIRRNALEVVGRIRSDIRASVEFGNLADLENAIDVALATIPLA